MNVLRIYILFTQDRALSHQAHMEESEKDYTSTLELSAQLVGLLTPPNNRSRPPPESSSSDS